MNTHSLIKFLFLIPLVLSLSSCKSTLNKKSSDEIGIIIQDIPLFSDAYYTYSVNDKPGIKVSEIIFNVINFISDTLDIDTLTLSREDFSNKDTVIVKRRYFLTIDEEITLSQLEKYLHFNNYQYINLRQHLYWMSRLSRAVVKENKNKYGDVDEIFLITPEGEHIPSDYWSYSSGQTSLSGVKYTIRTKRCVIAEKNISEFNVYINFVLDFSPPFLIFDTHYDKKIILNTTNEGDKYKTEKGRHLSLLIELNSAIFIKSNGQYSSFADFSPFRIKRL